MFFWNCCCVPGHSMVATCPYRVVRFPSCGIFKPTRTIPVVIKDFNLFYVNHVPMCLEDFSRCFLGALLLFFESPTFF